MVTLWKINDDATRAFMERYYKRLMVHESRSEALRRVKLEMLDTRFFHHPFYWASFIPIGALGPVELQSEEELKTNRATPPITMAPSGKETTEAQRAHSENLEREIQSELRRLEELRRTEH